MYTDVYDEFMKRNGFNKPFPQYLYHYTNGEAVINIMENNEFWITHVKYFNDRREYYDGVELILSVIHQRSVELGHEFFVMLKDIFLNEQWRDKPMNVGVLSFSAQRDLLSQWRGYTKLGVGFCLGFDTMKLYNQDIKAHFRPCIYSKPEKVKIVNRIIDELVQLNRAEGKSISELSATAFWLFQVSAITFKSPAFAEEDEWRLITFPLANDDKDWSFRCGLSTIIPFVKIHIDLKTCLEEVIIGPSENQMLTKNSLFYLMLKKEIWKNNITLSTVPYRSL